MPLPDSAHDILDAFEERLASGDVAFRRPNAPDELTERYVGNNGIPRERVRFPTSVVCRLLRRGEARIAGNKIVLQPAGWQAARDEYDTRKPPRGGQSGGGGNSTVRSK